MPVMYHSTHWLELSRVQNRGVGRGDDLGPYEKYSKYLGNNLVTALWPEAKVRRKFSENNNSGS